MRILGIDPALTITGYGVIDFRPNQFSLWEAGIVKTSSNMALTERLSRIYKAVFDLITEAEPEVAVVEKLYAHYRHPTTSYLLGQARGVICLACANRKVPLVEYAATRIKKAIVGNGLASKGQVQRMVAGALNLKELPKYSDVTDALALAIAHSYIAQVEKLDTKR